MNGHTLCFYLLTEELEKLDVQKLFYCGNQFFSVLKDLLLLQVKPSTIEMKEGGVRLRLTVVDTPGFGDAVDNTDW